MTFGSHEIVRHGVLLVVAFVAGAINSVAGGGTLLTFPTLILTGMPSITANATNTLALVPASLSAMWGYRDDIKGSRRELILLGVPDLIGGAIGALWVVHISDKVFSGLIPWLILGATGLFIVQEPLSRLARRNNPVPDSAAPSDEVPQSRGKRFAVGAFQVLVAVYGGFFGAGIGIMMLAALGMMGFARNIHRANGVKNFASACINGVAAVTFILEKRIDWPIALLMAVGAIGGGYGGADMARRLGQQTVRKVIVAIGLGIGVYMLVKLR